jgi:hypothetical protein
MFRPPQEQHGSRSSLKWTENRRWEEVQSLRNTSLPSFVHFLRTARSDEGFRHWPKRAIVAKLLVVDEFHLTVSAPHGLADSEYVALCRTLDDGHFQAALRRAVRIVCLQYADLAKARIRLSR